MKLLQLCASALLFSLLTACGGAGGDSTDVGPNNVAIQAIDPLIGVWNLPGDWNGRTGEEALLAIRRPNSEGEAEAVVYEKDDAGASMDCYIANGVTGSVTLSLTDELFLDLPFDNSATAVVELNPDGSMKIAVFAENGSPGADPVRTLTATRVGITETDVDVCE